MWAEFSELNPVERYYFYTDLEGPDRGHGLLWNEVQENTYQLGRYLIEFSKTNYLAEEHKPLVGRMVNLISTKADIPDPVQRAVHALRAKYFQDPEGKNLLLKKAIEDDHVESVETLLGQGATAPDSLHLAAKSGSENVVNYLLAHGSTSNDRDREGNTPLMAATKSRHNEMVELFLQQTECDPMATNNKGQTALHFAANQSGNFDLFDLIDNRQDQKARNLRDNTGLTPLLMAATNQRNEIVNHLLNVWSPRTPTEGPELLCALCKGGLCEAITRVVQEKGVDPNGVDPNGDTPLIIATRVEDRNAMKTLLEAGANVNQKGGKGRTALAEAFLHDINEGLIDFLAQQGADPNQKDDLGLTPLYYGCIINPESDVLLKYITSPQMVYDILELGPKRLQTLWSMPVTAKTRAAAKELYAALQPQKVDLVQIQRDRPKDFENWLQGSRDWLSAKLKPVEAGEMFKAWEKGRAKASEWAKYKMELSLTRFQELHKTLCEVSTPLLGEGSEVRVTDDDIFSGEARSENAYLLGVFVEKELLDFLHWFEDTLDKCDPTTGDGIIIAAHALQRIVTIHPFGDANGRVARAVMNYALERTGCIPAAIKPYTNYPGPGLFVLGEENAPPDAVANWVIEGVKNTCDLLKIPLQGADHESSHP